MKFIIASRGDATNPILWSSTPLNIYKRIKGENSCILINWSLFKPIFSFYCVVIGKLLFIWGSVCDPLLYKLGKRTIESKLKNFNEDIDYLFYVSGDLCISDNMIGKYRYAYYTDIYLPNVLPYYNKLKPFSNWFISKYKKNIKEQYERCDIIFSQNEWTRNDIINELLIDKDKVYNVRFGVNLTPYKGSKNYNENLLLIVLRKGTEEYKGLNLLLKAFSLVREKIKDVKLAVVGTDVGSDIEGVTCYYNQPRSTTIELFKKCTLYTMPAIREPNGITYLEGLANKAPIVGLNRFAFPEFSGYGEWGFICQNDDPQELADTITEALSDKDRLREMGEKGQKFVIENYDWDKVVDNMIRIMKEKL